MNPIVSICLPAYEDEMAVRRALKSLECQTLSSWECLIGDDSVSDAIQKLVAKNRDPRIKYIRNIPAKGVPQNWNYLISMAKGHFITLLHQDDFYINQDLLNSVVEALNSARTNLAVCAYSIWKKEKIVARYNNGEKNKQRFLIDFPQRSLIVNRIGHPSVIFFHKELKSVLFDTSLCYFLDTDWYARLWQAGGEPVYVPEAEVGIEKGRNFQLSQSCIKNFDLIDHELERAFKKWQASPRKVATGFARLYASQLRNISRTWPTLRKRIFLLSPEQRLHFSLALFPLMGHMGYRAMRKCLGFAPWA
ncbi:MAG: glycosyltransferase [Desulfovibrio sp.]|nr:glycosyltransferase [Desulfovibrio sp.]